VQYKELSQTSALLRLLRDDLGHSLFDDSWRSFLLCGSSSVKSVEARKEHVWQGKTYALPFFS
jgi:hypothetical protein